MAKTIVASRLDRIIDVQRKTITFSPSGQPVDAWATISGRRYSSVRPLRGDERFTADQWIAKQQVEFRIRWAQSVADVSPLDRVVYPPYEPQESPPEDPPSHQIYDIMEASEVGRREGLMIRAARRAEGGAS